ncbi:MAG: histidine kinase [Bacteroidetes bacterium HGW-Bacteroidetes-21]|jgi:hypothetical protein|nr:MAG: histidine kinase [Bacteroidetes bacterium HGW-Bacteroidetes-21]
MEDIEKYKKAKERIGEIKSFYVHLITYTIVNVAMVIYNLIVTPQVLWFVWPMMGWGIGILVHALSVFLKGRLFSKDWEDKKIKELMEKDQL